MFVFDLFVQCCLFFSFFFTLILLFWCELPLVVTIQMIIMSFLKNIIMMKIMMSKLLLTSFTSFFPFCFFFTLIFFYAPLHVLYFFISNFIIPHVNSDISLFFIHIMDFFGIFAFLLHLLKT
jgi:hypothetical protein